MQRIGLVVLGLTAIFALSACGGSGTTAPLSSYVCGPTGTDPAAKLVSPSNGASAVPPAVGSISYAYSFNSLAQPGPVTRIVLHPNNGGPDIDATYKSSANSVATATVPVLASGVTYTASVTTFDLAHIAGCPQNANAVLGSFTTQ